MKHPVDTSAWGEFVVGELFDNIYSVRQVKSQRNIVDELKGIPFVVQTQTNNMVKCYASKNTFNEHNVPIIKGNSIAMGVDLAVISYQENDYGGSHIIVAESDKLNPLRGKFIVAIMTAKLGPKYNYINKPGVQKYKQDVIPLPLKPSANPSNYRQEDIDWNYMETVMSRVTTRAKDRLANLPQPTDKKKTPVDTSAWGEFVVGELFDKCDLKRIKPDFNKHSDLSSTPSEKFNLPLINAKVGNNGIMYYGRSSDWESETMTLDIVQNGAASTGLVYAQPQATGVLWDAYQIKLKPSVHENLTVSQLLFLATTTQASIQNKFSYENKAIWNKVKTETIKLPLKASANPSNYTQDDIDWDYMENFMKAIETKAQTRLKSLQKAIA